MKNYISILKQSQLFSGVTENEIEKMLHCLGATIHEYPKGSYIFQQGEDLKYITVLVKGKLYVQRDDFWGNRSIIHQINCGEMFGEAYASPDSGPILNDVIAVEDSSVIFFDARRILAVCSSTCKFHTMVVQNLFFSISNKNRALMQKLGHMSKRTTRDKLISYLSEQAKNNNCETFDIPFNRQQLADFLSVDRSSMSNELCKMRNEGLLTFEKNRFHLYSL